MMKNTRLLERMYERDPHCYWCGCLTQRRPQVDGKNLPSDCATVDHLYSRLTIERHTRPGANREAVLACNRCNRWRANVEAKLSSQSPERQHAARRMLEHPGFRLIRNPFLFVSATLRAVVQ